MKHIFIFTLILFSSLKVKTQTWLPLDNGIGGCLSGHHIHSMFYDSIAGNLYVSGRFRADSECNEMKGFAVWNGTQFDSLANNNPSVQCHLQILFGNALYGSTLFGESLDSTVNLAVLQNGAWQPIQFAPSSVIECAYVYDDLLYLGGGYTECGGGDCYMLCTYDGEIFEPLVTDGYDGGGWRVQDITFYQGHLVAGGRFELLDENGESVWHLGKVSNGWMQPFEPPMTASSNVEALQVWENDLYIGGLLTPDGATNYRSIVKWDGTSYTDLSTYDYGDIHGPVNERITDIELYNDKLYIAGWFDQLEGQPCQGVACWDGSTWECLNTETISSLWNSVSDIEIINDTLYMAGDFTTIGGDTLHCIAKLNKTLTSVSEIQLENQINLFPNPTTSLINISSSTSHITQTSIFDITGRKVLNSSLKGNLLTIEVLYLSRGCYLIQVELDNGQVITKKLMKE
jgi:hypothetical protein